MDIERELSRVRLRAREREAKPGSGQLAPLEP